jgi:tripartite-type tricarboxylate transporter receptor subunit TctC
MKLPHRRQFLHLAAGAAALPAVPDVARAQSYPTRPVRIIVGFPPGFAADTVARLIAQSLSDSLRQQFVVENRPGAGSNIATDAIVRATPDGYSLLLVTQTNATNATLYENLGFNFIRDIAPVAGIGTNPFVMVVSPSVPAKTVPEFIDYAKANPGKVNMSSPGTGSAGHIFGELFKIMTGVHIVHVPYRASFIPDLLAGQVQVGFPTIGAVIEHIRTGKLRALAVTAATRVDVLPDIPALGEFVSGYEASGWIGIGAPRNTSAEIIETLNKAINTALTDQRMKARLADLGFEPLASSPAEFGKYIVQYTEKWGKVVRAANIKPD